ncbi:hypothetical protein PLICRDRAFT_179151 [Plicaturopsis crispa FD-325 SS-3]|uniref:Polysaccharide lyase family 7 protein n=1 Tax=Plicaturopsis crispa FD-325 SS-3 TaxID=944288 RepID=A0A0C9T659_PLICR|nr:hypothetical protein PLICRDRAFT_179151 [Plicaturopsis crispa FD-325 SS-3]
MSFSRASTVVLALLAATCADAAALQGRTTTLSTGTSMQYGTLSNGLKWQSSGILSQPCKSSTISNCYALALNANTSANLDPGFTPTRQRIEFRAPNSADNTSHTYAWSSYLSSSTGSGNQFFHLMQLFTDGTNGPAISLTATKGAVAIKDYARDCTATHCPSLALSTFEGRTLQHAMAVTFGPSGKLNYTVKDKASGKTLLSYAVTGSVGSSNTYLKFGTYRATYSGMTASYAEVGDYSST